MMRPPVCGTRTCSTRHHRVCSTCMPVHILMGRRQALLVPYPASCSPGVHAKPFELLPRKTSAHHFAASSGLDSPHCRARLHAGLPVQASCTRLHDVRHGEHDGANVEVADRARQAQPARPHAQRAPALRGWPARRPVAYTGTAHPAVSTTVSHHLACMHHSSSHRTIIGRFSAALNIKHRC
jgi:hypothetical protein